MQCKPELIFLGETNIGQDFMMITADLIWDENLDNDCEVSKDIWEDDTFIDKSYLKVVLPSYDGVDTPIVYHFKLNDDLKINSIKIPTNSIGNLGKFGRLNTCSLEAVSGEPPVLKEIIIKIDERLYDKLALLPKANEKKQYFQIKYNLVNKQSVIHEGNIWGHVCEVVETKPFSQGVIDFSVTDIVLIRSKILSVENKHDRSLVNLQAFHDLSRIPLKCLHYPVERSLLLPEPPFDDDNSIYVFFPYDLLSKLKISSGSFVRLSNSKNSVLVRAFLLQSPNHYVVDGIYTTPFVLAQFDELPLVEVEPVYNNELAFPTASEVVISKVGNVLHTQKRYQELILQKLRYYFLTARRILSNGSLIPITIDSSFDEIILEDIDLDVNTIKSDDDCIVWFVVSNRKFENISNYDPKAEFFVDPKHTKLITSAMENRSLSSNTFNSVLKYYGLPGVFHYRPDIFPVVNDIKNVINTHAEANKKVPNLPMILNLSSNVPKVGKASILRSIAIDLSYQFVDIDTLSVVFSSGSSDIATTFLGYLKGKLENLLPFTGNTIILIKHIDHILKKVDQNQDIQQSRQVKALEGDLISFIKSYSRIYPGVVFAFTSASIDNLPEGFRSEIKFDYVVHPPNEKQRRSIIDELLSTSDLFQKYGNRKLRIQCSNEIDISTLSLHSAGLSPYDIQYIISLAVADSLRKCNNYLLWRQNKIKVDMISIQNALEKVRSDYSASIGAPSIPNVTWDDVGGLSSVKDAIMETIDLPLKHPELFGSGLKKRSGILFYGPPGTGKTLLAKAIATNFSLNFFSVKGPELLNMYIGESEANVRRVFQKARDAKPCVIFFDEVDSVAPKRGNQGDSGGVMDRIVSQLLAELDGMSSDGDGVFIIGATNRPDLLDEALLRPGRFDKLIYLGIADTREKQANIMRALTRKFKVSSDINFDELVSDFPFSYTGADFYALCSDAMLKAMTRISKEIDEKVDKYNQDNGTSISIRYWFDHVCSDEDTDVIVKKEDFLNANKELIPSVSQQELEHYKQIRANFEDSK